MAYQLHNLIERFSELNILVIGDAMIDSYVTGSVDRISPEAPVPVLHVNDKELRPGGAANVALNIQSLGAKATLLSLCGDDSNANQLELLLDKAGVSHVLAKDKSRPTTIKTRLASHNHQMLRFDEESDEEINQELFDQTVLSINQHLTEEVHGVVLQDYNKGFLTAELIQHVIERAKMLNIPVAVDPKKSNIDAFKGATLFKPNLKEIENALGRSVDASDKEQLGKASLEIRQRLGTSINMITLSSYGIYADSADTSIQLPALRRDVSDVSGAGDTVISVATLCMALETDIPTMVTLANVAAGIVCAKFGVSPIWKTELQTEISGN